MFIADKKVVHYKLYTDEVRRVLLRDSRLRGL